MKWHTHAQAGPQTAHYTRKGSRLRHSRMWVGAYVSGCQGVLQGWGAQVHAFEDAEARRSTKSYGIMWMRGRVGMSGHFGPGSEVVCMLAGRSHTFGHCTASHMHCALRRPVLGARWMTPAKRL